MVDKKNKIDSAIDEVLESKRLKQVSIGLLKLFRLLAIIFIPFILFVGGMEMSPNSDAMLLASAWAVGAFILVLILNSIINKVSD